MDKITCNCINKKNSKNKIIKLKRPKNGCLTAKCFTGIFKNIFFKRYNVITISLPSSIIKIADRPFYQFKHSLKSIKINSELDYNWAFFKLEKLEKVLGFDQIKKIGNNAFNGCIRLNSIDTKNVEKIGNNAFNSCRMLKQTDLMNVKTIGEKAFFHSGLTAVKAPNLTKAADMAFSNCQNLESVQMDKITHIFNGCFSNDFKLKNINLPLAVIIGNTAFKNCDLSSFNINEGVKEIGIEAFDGSNLTTISLLHLKKIGNNALNSNCLEKVNCSKEKAYDIFSSTLNMPIKAFDCHCAAIITKKKETLKIEDKNKKDRLLIKKRLYRCS
ncbi:MAG: leucine-rich repeat domain-containing protein [Bacilli bacterium]